MGVAILELQIPEFLRRRWRERNGSELTAEAFAQLCDIVSPGRPLDRDDSPAWIEFHAAKALVALAKDAIDPRTNVDATLMYRSAFAHLRRFGLTHPAGSAVYLEEAKLG